MQRGVEISPLLKFMLIAKEDKKHTKYEIWWIVEGAMMSDPKWLNRIGFH